jgi:transposase
MKDLHIIGADISKKTVDFATPQRCHLKIDNNLRGYKALLAWLKQQNPQGAEVLIVMEHTGVYSFKLEQFLLEKAIAFAKVSALAIKRSLGLVRGKNDHIDAVRIARYGFEKRDQLQAFTPCSAVVQQLRLLYKTRNRLVRIHTGLLHVLSSYRDAGLAGEKDLVVRTQKQLLKNIERQLQKIEAGIRSLINREASVKANYELVQSQKGIGPVVALAVVVKTDNFIRFKTARKFCCYSGTAPFEHSSGSSIRGKTKVSPLADKDMKSKLFLAAESAIQHDKEIKAYYQKRIGAGKSRMSTLNIISNKLIFRMFAIVKRQTPFVENYKRTA